MKLPHRYWHELTTKEFAALDVARVIAVLPALPVGKSNEHLAFPGTLRLSAETLMRLWTEVARAVLRRALPATLRRGVPDRVAAGFAAVAGTTRRLVERRRHMQLGDLTIGHLAMVSAEPTHSPVETSGEPLQRRITAGLTRIALALRQASWRGAGARGLTPTQGLILTTLHRHPEGQRLSALAAALGVTKASASQVVTTLARKGLVAKYAVGDDGRGRRVALTSAGRREAARASRWGETVTAAVDTLSAAEQVALLRALVKVIRALQEAGAISPSRMCVTCRYFRPHVHANPLRPHHCAFVNAAFGDRALRLDCPDHAPAPEADAARAWKAFARMPS